MSAWAAEGVISDQHSHQMARGQTVDNLWKCYYLDKQKLFCFVVTVMKVNNYLFIGDAHEGYATLNEWNSRNFILQK